MKIVLRLSFVVVLVLLFLMVAPHLSAADPTGASPNDGLAPTCTYQTLGPGASIWLKIPYRFDYRLQFTLDANFVGGVKFDVYPSATASNPVGTGTYNKNEPTHDLNWEGQLLQDGFFYVLVTNTNPFAVQYRFCVNEKQPFHPQGASPAPVDPCAAICAAIGPGCLPGVCTNGTTHFNAPVCVGANGNGVFPVLCCCRCPLPPP